MKSPLRASKAQVVYQLYRDGNLEDPHIIDVQYPSDQDGLLLRGKQCSRNSSKFPCGMQVNLKQVDSY